MIDFAADDVGVRTQIGARLDAFTPTTAELSDSRRAAVTIAVTTVDGVFGIWLTRRPGKMREHGGQFALPGGSTPVRIPRPQPCGSSTRKSVSRSTGRRSSAGSTTIRPGRDT